MAKFLRLHIRGIRSVGDEDHQVHKVEFLSPCTLISGPNGTGKTTTIEALNFITTGQMPTQKKQAFIHSTDVARKTRVDASVALEFVDVKGRVCTAVRKLVATVGTKNTAQAEEHTLTIKYPDGTTQSLSSKVCDFNKAILHHLGVPKPIFKYVIFCHQEDSTWPLSEPKELKKRFDEIFQLTKFVKAQERMKKLVGDFDKDLRRFAVEQKLAESHIKEKLTAKKCRDECFKKISDGTERMSQVKLEKNDAMKKIEEVRSEIVKFEDENIAITKKEAERVNLKNQLALIEVEPYSGTEAELENEIEEARMNSGGRNFQDEELMIKRKIEKNNQEKVELNRSKNSVDGRISNLKAQSILRESVKNELKQLESDLCSELNIDHDLPFDSEFAPAVNRKVEELVREARNISEKASESLKESRKAQDAVTKIEVELKGLSSEKRKLEAEVYNLKTKIRLGENATSGMKEILQKEEKIRKELENLPELDEEAVKDCKRRRELVQTELDALKKLCAEAEKHSEKEKEVTVLKQSLTTAERKLSVFDEKHEKNWKGLFGRVPDAPFASEFSKISGRVRNEKKITENSLLEAQLNARKLETVQQQHRKYEEKLTSQELLLNEEIFDMSSCEPEEVSEKLSKTRKALKKARKDLAPISAKTDLYDAWIENTSTSGCCPLCDRDFATRNEVAEFSRKLHDMTLNFPSEQAELEKTVVKLEKEEATLVKAETKAVELEKIVKELAEVRAKNKNVQKDIEVENLTLAEKEKELATLNGKMKLVEALQVDVGIIDQLSEQIKEEGKRLKRLESLLEMSTGGDGRTYSQLRSEAEEKEKEYRKIVQSGEDVQKAGSERNRLQAKLNELGSRRVALGEAAAQTGAYVEQLEQKNREVEECENEIRTKEEDLPDARFFKEQLLENLKAADEKRNSMEMKMQMAKRELENKNRQWENMKKQLEDGVRGERMLDEEERNAGQIQMKLEENHQRQKRFEDDLRMLEGCYDKQKKLNSQKTRMRLELKMREVCEQLELWTAQGNTEGLVKSLKEELGELQNTLRLLGNEEIKLKTQIDEFNKQMKVADAKLNTNECRRAEVSYRDAILESALAEETIRDLNKYRKCLDVSLIKFHTEKMSAVNVIIDELWRKVYNSTDITTIRIRSDTKSETSTRNCAYDYNVMMVHESGAEVEMRGRCSAGQKMLASLLIRIALAEVFGGLCSMIALDEPTTNLDESKVDGMASVLNDLIEARRGYNSQGNHRGREMQMVVITHDERLVNKLTIGCRPEYIYCLGKNEHGISFLSKKLPDGREIRITS